jgi:hypothetical protein
MALIQPFLDNCVSSYALRQWPEHRWGHLQLTLRVHHGKVFQQYTPWSARSRRKFEWLHWPLQNMTGNQRLGDYRILFCRRRCILVVDISCPTHLACKFNFTKHLEQLFLNILMLDQDFPTLNPVFRASEKKIYPNIAP